MRCLSPPVPHNNTHPAELDAAAVLVVRGQRRKLGLGRQRRAVRADGGLRRRIGGTGGCAAATAAPARAAVAVNEAGLHARVDGRHDRVHGLGGRAGVGGRVGGHLVLGFFLGLRRRLLEAAAE
jgi:hypothetical protein